MKQQSSLLEEIIARNSENPWVCEACEEDIEHTPRHADEGPDRFYCDDCAGCEPCDLDEQCDSCYSAVLQQLDELEDPVLAEAVASLL